MTAKWTVSWSHLKKRMDNAVREMVNKLGYDLVKIPSPVGKISGISSGSRIESTLYIPVSQQPVIG